METVIKFDDVKVDHNLFPSYLSFSECTDYAIMMEEENFNKIFHNIALEELALFESSGINRVYTTEAEGKGFFSSITEWFKNAWKTIKSLFDKFLETIANKINDMKNKLADSLNEKILSQAEAMASNVKDPKKVFAKIHDFGNLKGELSHVNTVLGSINVNNPDIEEMYKTASDRTGKAIEKGKIGDLKKATLEWLVGGEKEIFIKDIKAGNNDLLSAIKSIKDHKFFSNGIKKDYNETKKLILDATKKFSSNKENSEEKIKQRAEASKDAVKAITAVCGSTISAYHQLFRESAFLVLRLAALATKTKVANSFKKEKSKEDDKKENETANVESGAFYHEISRLFAWDV